jgi:hypothetical protein
MVFSGSLDTSHSEELIGARIKIRSELVEKGNDRLLILFVAEARCHDN